MKFRKKPVVIEAIQYDGANADEIRLAFSTNPPNEGTVTENTLKQQLIIWTLEGPMIASKSDWIIRGIKGELYPCKPDIFAATYEQVGATTKGEQ